MAKNMSKLWTITKTHQTVSDYGPSVQHRYIRCIFVMVHSPYICNSKNINTCNKNKIVIILSAQNYRKKFA